MDDNIRPIKFHARTLQQISTLQQACPEKTLSRLVNEAIAFYLSETGMLEKATKEVNRGR